MRNNFFSKTIFSITGAFGNSGTNLLIGIALARWLGPSDLGRYQMIVSSGIIAASICSFGLGGAIVYYIRNSENFIDKITSTIFKVSTGLGLVLILLLFAVYSWQSYFGDLTIWTIFSAAMNGSFLLLISVNSQVLIAKQDVIQYQLVGLIPRISLLLMMILIWHFFVIDLELSIAMTAISFLLGCLLLIYLLRSHIHLSNPIDTKLLKNMIAYGSMMSLSYVVILINNESMNLMLGFFLKHDFKEVGFFSRAFRTGVILLTFAMGIKPLLFSQLSGLSAKERLYQMERVQRVWGAIAVIPLIIVWIWAEQIIVLLFSKEYLPSVPIFRISVIGSFFYSFIIYHIGFYSAAGKPVITSLVMGFNLFLLILGGFFLIPTYKGIGMAYTYSFATLISLGASLLICRNKFGMKLSSALLITKSDIQYLSSKLIKFC